MRFQWIVLAAFLGALIGVPAAEAQFSTLPVSKCNATKVKAVGKTAAQLLGCHRKGGPDLALCLAKVGDKFDPAVPGKGAFEKADAKNQGCLPGTTDNQASYRLKLDGFTSDVGTLLGIPATPSKCDAARLRCVAKYVAGTLGCVAKAAGKLGGAVDPACLSKQAAKFSDPIKPGCYDRATEACSNGTTAAVAQADADAFIAGTACQLLPGATPCPAVCGNGFIEPGEFCDAPDAGACGPDFPCTGCSTCACPTALHLTGDANDPASTVIDVGWRGYGHRAPLQTGTDLSLTLACGPTTRPCGVCTVGGVVGNTGPGELRNQRCSNDTSIQCSDDTPCTPGGGTCELFFGAPLPFSAAGVPLCLLHPIDAVGGTMNVESGQAFLSAALQWQVFNGDTVDTPCPTCAGDATANDGAAGGSCSAGPRIGLACDGNASVPGRPDYGVTSFDCPPSPAGFVSASAVDLELASETQTMTLSAASPGCTGTNGIKCLCDTCNNANADPCSSNADCPPSGGNPGVCGGRRCIGGANDGGPCGGSGGGASACPGGSCGRPGEPTHPNGCIDGYDYYQCVDEAPLGDHAGVCEVEIPGGYITTIGTCSNHPQRNCSSDSQCDSVPGACVIHPLPCFLDEGELGGQIVAPAATDTPVADVTHPELGSVFCVGPTQSNAANAALGLPGPARLLMKATVVARP